MKHRIFGKKKIVFILLILFWAAVLITVFALTAAERAAAGERKLPVYSVARDDRKLALTFNAAWGDETTEEILDCLQANGIKATFFIVGEFADRYPESIKKIFAAGHELGNHSMRHKDPTQQAAAEVLSDILRCNDRIWYLTGVSPVLYRAPSGSYDNKTLEAAESLGMTAVQWSADSIDWKDPSPETIVSRILKRASPGGIVLFHLGKENTAEALPQVIAALKEEGYQFCTVSELLLPGETYVDPDGVQRPVADK